MDTLVLKIVIITYFVFEAFKTEKKAKDFQFKKVQMSNEYQNDYIDTDMCSAKACCLY